MDDGTQRPGDSLSIVIRTQEGLYLLITPLATRKEGWKADSMIFRDA